MTGIIEECEICNYRPDKKDIKRCPNCGGKIIIKVKEGLNVKISKEAGCN
jgi:DNA-directed RNA polymerase subunit RPC12/RpoP